MSTPLTLFQNHVTDREIQDGGNRLHSHDGSPSRDFLQARFLQRQVGPLEGLEFTVRGGQLGIDCGEADRVRKMSLLEFSLIITMISEICDRLRHFRLVLLGKATISVRRDRLNVLVLVSAGACDCPGLIRRACPISLIFH